MKLYLSLDGAAPVGWIHCRSVAEVRDRLDWIEIESVVGSRKYPALEAVDRYVDSLSCAVVSGGADGVDSRAQSAALRRGLPFVLCPVTEARIRAFMAEGFSRYIAFSKAAHERDEWIAQVGDRLTGFSFNRSRGTAATARYAARLGKPVKVWEWPDAPDHKPNRPDFAPCDCALCREVTR